MLTIIGLAIVFVGIFGGYVLSGGKMGIILHALPFEGIMIGGGAIGSFLAANGGTVSAKAAKGIGRTIKGSKWKKAGLPRLTEFAFCDFKDGAHERTDLS